MDWLRALSRRQQLTIILTIVIFGVRYAVLDFLATRPSWVALSLTSVLFPETYFVPVVLEPMGWSETSIAFWMYLTMLLTSYLCAMLIIALRAGRSEDTQ